MIHPPNAVYVSYLYNISKTENWLNRKGNFLNYDEVLPWNINLERIRPGSSFILGDRCSDPNLIYCAMINLSGALLPKSSKSLCLQREGVAIPAVNLGFERGQPRKFCLEESLGIVWLFTQSVLLRVPLPYLQFLGLGSFWRGPQASEKLWMLLRWRIWLARTWWAVPLSRMQGVRNSVFSSARESTLGQC